MPLGRLVPWHSWEEWHQVRLGLFSADHNQRQFAIERVRGTQHLAAGHWPPERVLTTVHAKSEVLAFTCWASSWFLSDKGARRFFE